MISDIRRKFKVQGFKAVLWLVIISMAAGFLLLRRETGSSTMLLSINGQEISARYFEQQIYKESERIQLLRQQFGFQADMYLQALGLGDPKVMAFYTIVRETLLNQAAEKIGFDLSPGFVMQKLYEPQFVVNSLIDLVPVYIINPDGTINKEKLVQYLRFSGKTMAQFEESIEQAIKRLFTIDSVNLSAYVDPADIKNYFIQRYLGKQFEILILPFDTFKTNAQAQKVTADDLKNFFAEENRKARRYWIPEKRSGVAYIFNPAAYGLTIADKDVQEYYDSHKSKYVQTPAQIQVRRILFKVEDRASAENVQKVEEKAKKIAEDLKLNPGEFEKMARMNSDDKETAKAGGLMPYFSRGTHDATFEKAAFRLKDEGDISDLIVTDKGFEILQKVGRKAIEYKPLATVKSQIIQEMQNQNFKSKFTEDVNKIVNQTKATPEMVQQFAESKKAQKVEIPLSGNDNALRMQKLFGLKKIGQSIYYVDNGQGVVLTLNTIAQSNEPSLNEVEKQVKEDYYQAQAKKALRQALDKAKNESKDQSFDAIAKASGGTVEKTGFIKKDDQQALAKLTQKNIPSSLLFSLERPGTVIDHVEKNGYLIKLVAIQPLEEAAFLKEKPAIESQLYKEQKLLIENGFIASLFRNATIKSRDPQFNIKG